MRTLQVILSSVIMVAMAGCPNHRQDETPPDQVTRTGTLHSGFMAIGGEHPGWELHGEEPPRRLEVDVTHIHSEAIRHDGRRVTITGRMVDRGYVERGRVPTLVAERIEPAQ